MLSLTRLRKFLPRRAIGVIVVGLAACTGPTISTPTLSPPPTEFPLPTPTLEPAFTPFFTERSCFTPELRHWEDGSYYDLTCGMVTVLADRSDPQGATIQLPVTVFRSKNPDSQPDPVIYLTGGGGADQMSHVDFYIERVGNNILQERDFILYNQRGARHTKPELLCDGWEDLNLELAKPTADGGIVSEEERWQRRTEYFLACREELLNQGIDLAMYNTAINAADAADLRIALGYEEANYYGTSYGTRLALFLMRYYPEGVRSVILDSVYPPQIDYYSEYAFNAHRTISYLFEICALDQICNSTYPDLEEDFYRAVDRLNAKPASTIWEGEEVIYNGGHFIDAIYMFLYTAQVELVPAAVTQAADGNYQIIEEMMPWVLALPPDIISWPTFFSLQCQEEVPFDSPENVLEWNRDLPAPFIEYYQSFQMHPFPLCETWDVPVSDPVDDTPVVSDIPTLIFAGEYDPITPPQWSKETAETLRNSFYYEFVGLGHGVMRNNICALEIGLQFIDDPSSEPDTSCMDSLAKPRF